MSRNRKSAQIKRDRRKISELYLKGKTQDDIAAEVDLNQSTVSRDLKAIQKIWQKETLLDFNEAKARELERIDVLEREYWQAWERSCEDAETVRQEGKPKTKDDKPDKVVRTRKGQAGDPRFLQGVQWCIMQRCKILGIEAPTKQEISGPDAGPQEVKIDFSNLTDEQFDKAFEIATGRAPIKD